MYWPSPEESESVVQGSQDNVRMSSSLNERCPLNPRHEIQLTMDDDTEDSKDFNIVELSTDTVASPKYVTGNASVSMAADILSTSQKGASYNNTGGYASVNFECFTSSVCV